MLCTTYHTTRTSTISNVTCRIGSCLLVGFERSKNNEKKEGSVTLSCLWLKRALDFLDRFLKKYIHGHTTTLAAKEAYETELAPYQGWVIRTTCKTAMRMVPSREKVGQTLLKSTVDPIFWEQTVMEELSLMMASFSVVVQDMDSYFEREGLDFKDKV